jgi:nucleotide-binding universal stress UspA family protein
MMGHLPFHAVNASVREMSRRRLTHVNPRRAEPAMLSSWNPGFRPKEPTMSYRNILVHLDNQPGCALRITAALDLAERYDARLVGLATTGVLVLPYGLGMVPSGEVLAEWEDYLGEQARAATARFAELAGKRGFTRIESRIAEGIELSAITLNARYTDLVVVGQPEPGGALVEGPRVSPGEVVLESPRPVLVVPYIGAPAGFGQRILIAWNGSREASRAVTDSLPLLQRAARVVVMAVNPVIDPRGHGDLPGADLAAYLAHHGVNVEVHPDNGPVTDVAAELLSRCADLEIDLLVMGAYGHSRAREWAFGGATHTVLRSMTVPVLLSH